MRLLLIFVVHPYFLQTGTGILYEMCKKAMISKNYKELDEAIKQKLPPYLYNGGQGQYFKCFLLSNFYSEVLYYLPVSFSECQCKVSFAK